MPKRWKVALYRIGHSTVSISFWCTYAARERVSLQAKRFHASYERRPSSPV
jgi:hypothetical protein